MPRKRTKTKDISAHEPKALAAVLEESPATESIRSSREAKSQIEPERPMPGPDEAVAAFQRQREREQAVTESHVAQLGPRKRSVNEPGSIFTGTGFKLMRDADYYYFKFDEPPSEDRQRVMKQLLFAPEDDSQKSWKSRDWAKATAYAQGAAIWFQGKDISHGRCA